MTFHRSSEVFFENQSGCSKAKTAIIAEYFSTWASIIDRVHSKNASMNNNRIFYIDLFSGPGTYEDGTPSTPILVLEKAKRLPALTQKRINFVFNDRKQASIESLKEKINHQYPELFEKCIFSSQEIGYNDIDELAAIIPKNCQSLCLLDPWGYKGLSISSMNNLIKNWGSEVIFFFNYSRIRAAITNAKVQENMQILFGDEPHRHIMKEIQSKKMLPKEAESFVLTELESLFKLSNCNYVLPFRFIRGSGGHHHLVFITKHRLGFLKMKEVMKKHSLEGGISSGGKIYNNDFAFEYTSKQENVDQQILPFGESPKEKLEEELLDCYQGQTIKMEDIYYDHGGKPSSMFSLKEYKTALYSLYENQLITVNRPPKKRNSFANDIIVTFPPKHIQE